MLKLIRALPFALLLPGVAAVAEEKQGLTPMPQPGFSQPAAAEVPDTPATVGAVATAPSLELEVFESKKGRFSISYPADWLPVAHPAMAFQARPALDSLFVLRVQVSKAQKGATAKSFAAAQVKRFAKFWTVDGEEEAMLGGEPAWRITHLQMIEGRMTRAEKLFAVKDGRAFMLDCQANPSSFGDLQPVCLAAANSFAFR